MSNPKADLRIVADSAQSNDLELTSNLVPNSYHTAVAQTLLAIAALDGKLEPSSQQKMEEDVAFTNAWCGRRNPVHSYSGNVLEFETLSWTDKLLGQLQLSIHKPQNTSTRSGWWSLMTDPALASDYAALLDEYRNKYMAEPEVG